MYIMFRTLVFNKIMLYFISIHLYILDKVFLRSWHFFFHKFKNVIQNPLIRSTLL